MRRPRTAVLVTLAALTAIPVAAAAGHHRAGSSASIRVLSPAAGAVATGNTLPTRVAISGFRVDGMLAGKKPVRGVGHYHIHLDGVLRRRLRRPDRRRLAPERQAGQRAPTFVLAQNNHMELSDTTKTVTFTYKPTKPLPTIKDAAFPGKPSIRITAPANGATVHGSFAVTVAVKNFRLSPTLFGKPDVAGVGHWTSSWTRRR